MIYTSHTTVRRERPGAHVIRNSRQTGIHPFITRLSATERTFNYVREETWGREELKRRVLRRANSHDIYNSRYKFSVSARFFPLFFFRYGNVHRSAANNQDFLYIYVVTSWDAKERASKFPPSRGRYVAIQTQGVGFFYSFCF